MIISPKACVCLGRLEDESSDNMASLKLAESMIFEVLKQPDDVARVVDTITNLPLARQNPDMWVSETANLIAAAASVEKKSYISLVYVVRELTNAHEAMKKLPLKVTRRCLFNHTHETNHFLLLLLIYQIIDIHLIYVYLKRNGAFLDSNLLTFLYFLPELFQAHETWTRRVWSTLHTPVTAGPGAHYIPELIQVASPPEWRDKSLDEIDFKQHVLSRNSGQSSSELLRIIRDDDPDLLIPLVAGTDFSQSIPFSLYESFLHINDAYNLWKEADEMICLTRQPRKYMQVRMLTAVIYFGAERCWSALLDLDEDSVLENLTVSDASLVIASGSESMMRILDHFPHLPKECMLNAVTKFHLEPELEWLLDEHACTPNAAIMCKAIHHCNYSAVELIFKHLSQTDLQKSNIWCQLAMSNSIAMFKYLLARVDQLDYSMRKGRFRWTMFHWASAFMGVDILDFWCDKFNQRGLNFIDEQNRNPYQYLYTLGIYEKSKDRTMEARKPEYHHFKQLTLSSEGHY